MQPQSPSAESQLRSRHRWPYLVALRPHQWTKNIVVSAAPLFAFSLNVQTLLGSLLAFMLFCGISSSFYLLNDIVDVESDRRHPVKCKRPIASGQVSIPVAIGMAIILSLGTLSLGWLRAPELGITLVTYAILQVAYNFRLKREPIMDIIAISMGFVLRAVAGIAANGLPLSPWFLICAAMLALFLAIEKRKAELIWAQAGIGKTRKVLEFYSLPVLTRMESSATSGALISYTLWSAGPVVGGADSPWMLLTLPFVLYGIFRYQLLSDQQGKLAQNSEFSEQQTERPETVLLRDRPIQVTIVLWVLLVFMIFWLHGRGIIA
ncbi:MAG: decaprenyl-phosphate phosphoribosyltransferase [Spirulina sp. SIO3F2]|nr:decaprenyl-phosphate phosphoribosyltransferase [Spirulina sp. SIO3F2]